MALFYSIFLLFWPFLSGTTYLYFVSFQGWRFYFLLSPNSRASRANSLGMNRSYLAYKTCPFLVLSFSHDVMQLFFWMTSMCLPQQVCYFIIIIIILFIFLKGKFHPFIKKNPKKPKQTKTQNNPQKEINKNPKPTFFFSRFPFCFFIISRSCIIRNM